MSCCVPKCSETDLRKLCRLVEFGTIASKPSHRRLHNGRHLVCLNHVESMCDRTILTYLDTDGDRREDCRCPRCNKPMLGYVDPLLQDEAGAAEEKKSGRGGKREKEKEKREVRPCYRQGENTCGYWSVRTAVEWVLGRQFDREEKRVFQTFKDECHSSGSMLDYSTGRFRDHFPHLARYIEFRRVPPLQAAGRRTTRRRGNVASDNDKVFVTIDDIREGLSVPGAVLLLNVQNMDFEANKVVHNPGRGGDAHAICCTAIDEGKDRLILQDTNTHRRSCVKYLHLSKLREGMAEIEAATGDLERIGRAQRKAFHIAEMYVVRNTQPDL
jgi:hypothetical protein